MEVDSVVDSATLQGPVRIRIYMVFFRNILLCFLFASPSFAQLKINEVSASCNDLILVDDNGSSQDWIEIFNPTITPVLASNFYLSDNASVTDKWQMPAVMIPAGGFLVVYASGEDRVSGAFYHSNFNIGRSGDDVHIFSSTGSLISSLTYGDLDLNHSYGPKPDGSAVLGVFDIPTPGASNNGSTQSAGYCPAVAFSVNGGFFSTAQTVALTCPGYDIYWSLDGSIPTTGTGFLYAGPINVPATQAIKARAFPSSGTLLPGPIKCETYFIAETDLGNAPVLSITLDPADFLTVYYATNYATNYFPQGMAHLEYYKNQNAFLFETDFDLKLHGTTTTTLPQKGLRVLCRGEYHKPSIKDTLFPYDKAYIQQFDGFNLRHDNGGGAAWDPYSTSLMSTLDVDYLAYRPCIVFINGTYWGEYQLRETGNEAYIEGNHPEVNKDSVDLLRHNYDWSTATNDLVALAGSDTGFFNQLGVINALDPTTTTFHDYFAGHFDTSNFFDYFISEIYVGNTDWLVSLINNVKLWRDQSPVSKWRYILYDLDYAIGIQTPGTDIFPDLFAPAPINYHAQIFSQVVQNPGYKNYFINRFADLLNTRFLADSANAVAIAMRDTLDPIIQRHLATWGSTSYSTWLGWWDTYWIGTAGPRQTALRNHIESNFSMNQQVNVTFEVYPAGAGSVLLNTINPQIYPWNGVYFDGEAIHIASSANAGYAFDHWESTVPGLDPDIDAQSVNLNGDYTIELHFTSTAGIPENDTDGISVYPNPSTGKVFISHDAFVVENVQLAVYCQDGKKVSERTTLNISGASTDISFLFGGCVDGLYLLEIISDEERSFKRVVISR